MPNDAAATNAECGHCELSRRAFMRTAMLSAAGLVLAEACGDGKFGEGPLPSGALPAGVTVNGNVVTIDLATATALTTSPRFVVIFETKFPVIIVNSGGTYIAYDARCPHEGHTQFWSYDGTLLTCRAHGSGYDVATGAARVFPAFSPMISLPATRAGGTVTVTVA
jgi:nitrite reductase/ring-hydroxylating ferredoxin subunit